MIGSGRETMFGLAAGLSATEDRELLTQLDAESQFGFAPSFEVTSQGHVAPANSDVMLDSMHNFEPNLMGFDDALDPSEEGIDETFFDKDDPLLNAIVEAGGTPWPTPWTEPDDWAISASAGQVSSPAPLSGFEGGIFAESLRGLEVAPSVAGKNARKAQLKAAVIAAFEPGSKRNQAAVKKLLDRSLRLAALAEKRAAVTKKARDAFQANLKRIEAFDREIARLVPRVFEADGKLKKTASDKELKRLLLLRKKNIELGRRAVRLQKLNVLASAITQNTLTQLITVQNMAQAVSSGAPQAVPALGLAFDRLGRENVKIKKQRQKQLDKWDDKKQVGAARAMSGFEGFDDLYGFDAIEAPFDQMENDLAALEFSFRKTFRKAKKTFKKAGKIAKSTAKSVGKAGNILVKAAVVAPLKGTVKAAQRIVKGDVKGAFKAIGKSVVEQAKGVKDFAALTVLKWSCDIANTKAFKSAVQAVGQAVGTAVGSIAGSPTIGGAIGAEAGGQAANTQRNTCGAMKTIGLTSGKFRPGRIDDAAKGFAKRAWKETLSPKAQLRSLKNIAKNAIGGQFASAFNVGGVDVMSKIGLDANKLVAGNPMLKNLYKKGISEAQGALQKGAAQVLTDAGVPYASTLVSLAQSGKVPDLTNLLRNVDVKALTAQGVKMLQREATAIAQRELGKTLTRTVPSISVKGAARAALRAEARAKKRVQARARARVSAQLSPASVERAAPPMQMLSKFISEATEDASPYVGSIGRDY